MIVEFAMTQRPLDATRERTLIASPNPFHSRDLGGDPSPSVAAMPDQTTKTRRGGYVFSVRPVNAEDGAAFRMERAAIGEVNQCVMDALSPRAC